MRKLILALLLVSTSALSDSSAIWQYQDYSTKTIIYEKEVVNQHRVKLSPVWSVGTTVEGKECHMFNWHEYRNNTVLCLTPNNEFLIKNAGGNKLYIQYYYKDGTGTVTVGLWDKE